MAEPVKAKRLDFGAAAPEEARAAIKSLFANEPDAVGKVYSALAHKVWSLLIERRLDTEIRDWHALLHAVRATVRTRDDKVSERFAALADLVRESISFAETSSVRDVARRPHARRILEILAAAEGFVPRRELMRKLGLKTANLSNVLTQLGGLGLVERRAKLKEAEFRITALGREMAGIESARDLATMQILRAILKMRTGQPNEVRNETKDSETPAKRYPEMSIAKIAKVEDSVIASSSTGEERVVGFGFGKSRRVTGLLITAQPWGTERTARRGLALRSHF